MILNRARKGKVEVSRGWRVDCAPENLARADARGWGSDRGEIRGLVVFRFTLAL
jgi:hypothetical protein